MSLNKPVAVETKGSVAGEVRDFDTDELLAGVSVATVPVTSTQSTDSSGHFSFSALQEATYIFKLSKAGYVSKAETAFVRATEELALTIRMQSTDTLAGIWGRVVDDISGAPVSAARISTVPVTRTVLTDSSGVFQIQDIPVGLVTVKVAKTEFDSAQVAFNAMRRRTDSISIPLHHLTPKISVSKDLVEFGISGSADSFMVTNAGIGTLHWAVQETLSWLTVFPESGDVATLPATVRLTASRTGLTPGPCTGLARVVSEYGKRTINISMMVPDPVNPALDVSKSRLEFDSATTRDTLRIFNAGAGQLTWTATKNAGWITLGLSSGTIQTDTSVIMVVTASAAGLAAGNYSDTIAFSSNGGTRNVLISLAVKGTANLPPAFTSGRANMDSVAAVGNLYRDTVTATDPNGDSLTYSVISGVTGMALANRVVTWLPTAGDTGTKNVAVRVIDGRGGADTLAWVIRVSAINRPPVFTSTAAGMDSAVVVGATSLDTLYAADPDNDALSYSYLSSITGMALTANVVSWTPGLSDTGTKAVSVQVSDGKGGKDTLSWNIVVRDTNHAPVFSSTASDMEDSAAIGVQYRDTVHARDPDGNAVTFSFIALPSGMTRVDSIITWTPGDTGTKSVSIKVSDGKGKQDTLAWTIIVHDTNHAPVFLSTLTDMEDSAVVGVQYRDTVHAWDPDGDIIAFSFISSPTGMTLTDSIITWTPSNSDTGTRAASIRVFDIRGGCDTLNWLISVPAPTPPQALVAIFPFTGNANDQTGNGNNGTVNGASLTTDRFGRANSAYQIGNGSNIAIANRSALNPLRFSAAVWVLFDRLAPVGSWDNQFLLCKGNDVNGGAYIISQNHDQIHFYLGGHNSGDFTSLATPNLGLQTGRWYHIVATFDSATMAIAVNGVTTATKSSVSVSIGNTDSLRIGYNALSGYEYYLNGKIDDVAFYSKVLLAAEIDSLYHSGGWTSSFTIGQTFGGGKIFYVDGSGQHGLIAAPNDQSTYSPWGCMGTFIGSTGTAVGAGISNTSLIVSGCSEMNTAARICDTLSLGGFTDWYLPSKEELNLLFLKKNNIGGFADMIYWSSTEINSNPANEVWGQFFNTGEQYALLQKRDNYHVRAIRPF